MKNLITGGSGFIGSNLTEKLLLNDEEVICIDNLSSGNFKNIEKWENSKNFKFINFDITYLLEENFNFKVDRIWHFACPGSPKKYQKEPIKTSQTIIIGLFNLLNFAYKNDSQFLFASSSEIYGNPIVHPQIENYFGNVNPIGKRSCYEEGKRMSESICTDFKISYQLPIKIARIFNTYGPRMLRSDGRVISNFIYQGLEKKPLSIYGDGSQTRSFCFIDDQIEGLIKLMNSNYTSPINIGSDEEISIRELSKLIHDKLDREELIQNMPLPLDDPKQRRPDISLAKKILDWQPKVDLESGLDLTIKFIRSNQKFYE